MGLQYGIGYEVETLTILHEEEMLGEVGIPAHLWYIAIFCNSVLIL